ncbi:uncharacterized protein Gasu_36790 [Galdieria sulphuraria]|uniref:Transmembrane protein n=1 Tax=Galdieria sulphuraria TaxID=130081 RepID=M2WY05_GALSU|nr:uncharacterized protein Gasu_36790 [Galdieria sulphuraria]EME28945.1 hypothetical protein Gasu_36790 [Galdieria sulphuraria]|eukprot:XP_005705465.1 hypothetical protein Gasu_36790 [Galdieria sulphuraria]
MAISNSQLFPIPLPLPICPFFPSIPTLQDNFQTKVALPSFTRNRPFHSPIHILSSNGNLPNAVLCFFQFVHYFFAPFYLILLNMCISLNKNLSFYTFDDYVLFFYCNLCVYCVFVFFRVKVAFKFCLLFLFLLCVFLVNIVKLN